MAPPSSSCFSNYKKKEKNELRTFYNISDNKVDGRFKGIEMPCYRQCRGSSHGWLITVDDDDHKSFSVRLFNPFFLSSSLPLPLPLPGSGNTTNTSGIEIMLPNLSTFPIPLKHLKYRFKAKSYDYLRKAVLSANPISSPKDYKVMAIYSGCGMLAFFKSGHKAWTPVKIPNIEGRLGGYQDVIYYQGKFLAVDLMGTIVVCDHVAKGGMTARVLVGPPKITDNNPKTRIIESKYNNSKKYIINSKYIVESSRGTLLHVQRDMLADEGTFYSTIGFRVFELVLVHDHPIFTNPPDDHQKVSRGDGLREDYYEWVELESLCGDTIFLGHNGSMSISASDHYSRCKPNSIYYVDDSDFYITDRRNGPHDTGVFNLEDGSFERNFHFLLDHKDDTSTVPIWPIPIWIQPSLPKGSTTQQLQKEKRRL